MSVLQERLESTRSQLYDQDKLVEQLRSDLQVAAEELQYWKEQRTQDMEKLEQVEFTFFLPVMVKTRPIHFILALLFIKCIDFRVLPLYLGLCIAYPNIHAILLSCIVTFQKCTCIKMHAEYDCSMSLRLTLCYVSCNLFFSFLMSLKFFSRRTRICTCPTPSSSLSWRRPTRRHSPIRLL